jgi:hypothetical protein
MHTRRQIARVPRPCNSNLRARKVAVASGATLAGTENCNTKLLVMLTVVEACFDGSATLRAVSVTV